MASNNDLPNLPWDMIYEILSLLPVKSLCRFKLVSKGWNNLFECTEFAEYHRIRSWESETYNNWSFVISSSYNSLYLFHDLKTFSHYTKFKLPQHHNKVIGTCNSLVCLISSNVVSLCNPSTRTLRQVNLPQDIGRDGGGFQVGVGFGYDYFSDDYKVVVVKNYTKTWVYSLMSDTWKNTESPMAHISCCADVVYLNNCLHWLRSSGRKFIHRFDLHNEKWDEIPLPYNIEYEAIFCGNMHLGKLDGYLCFSFSLEVERLDEFEYDYEIIPETHVWIMYEYGIQESWTKWLYISGIHGYPLTSTGPSDVILHQERYHSSLWHYNFHWYPDEVEQIYDPPFHYSRINFNVESPTPLKGNVKLIGEEIKIPCKIKEEENQDDIEKKETTNSI